MNRFELIQKTRDILAKTGFYLSEPNETRMICFDILARRDNQLIILKILTNVDSFTKQNSDELTVLSDMLKGAPILVGERSSKKKIESGIVYYRHGIPLINSKTLHDFYVEGVPPLIGASPGGFYVNIDGKALKNAREIKKVSLGALAEVAGVSRKAIQMYENGMSTMIEVAIRLEEYLDLPLIQPMDPLSLKFNPELTCLKTDLGTDIKHEIFTQLQGLGYNVVPTKHCPFDALTKDKSVLIITGISKANKKTIEKARVMFNISKITEHYSVMFLEDKVRKPNLEGTPIIHTGELKKIEDSEDILTLISERS